MMVAAQRMEDYRSYLEGFGRFTPVSIGTVCNPISCVLDVFLFFDTGYEQIAHCVQAEARRISEEGSQQVQAVHSSSLRWEIRGASMCKIPSFSRTVLMKCVHPLLDRLRAGTPTDTPNMFQFGNSSSQQGIEELKSPITSFTIV